MVSYKINSTLLLLELVNAAYVKRIISRLFQCIILVIVCLIKFPVATIVEKSGQSTGLIIDTYTLHSYPDINTRVGRALAVCSITYHLQH